MKKSNVVIALIAVLASVFLLWLWFYLSFDKVDQPVDLVLSVVWWVLVAVAVYAIVKFEAKRQERVRTVYVSDAQLFNSEKGLVARDGALVPAIEELLSGLKYNFNKAELPNKDEVQFTYLVRSKKFDANGDAGGAGNEGSGKDPAWEGEVVTVATGDAQAFKGKAELEVILAAA